ncbi:MAG: hypothetical protein EBR82_39055 [Caulobacteraceae bacterium]|nr:hypothetical protein [Caulobacteraceae bacterium]
MNWTCPRCQSVNETVTNEQGEVMAEQTCATCAIAVEAKLEVAKPPTAPAALPTSKARKVRKKGQEIGTVFLILCALPVLFFGFVFAGRAEAGVVIACAAICLMLFALTYHLGERLDLILEEIQNGNDESKEERK